MRNQFCFLIRRITINDDIQLEYTMLSLRIPEHVVY
jgi:hypothetical protein